MQNNSAEQKELSSLQKIQQMTVAQKMELARKGTKEDRTTLIRDSNKLVQMAVIQSPKITESEVVAIAANRQINDEVLRFIAGKREWFKNYSVKVTLINNPKTPLPTAMKIVPLLNRRDLEQIARSKAVPRALVTLAQSRLRTAK